MEREIIKDKAKVITGMVTSEAVLVDLTVDMAKQALVLVDMAEVVLVLQLLSVKFTSNTTTLLLSAEIDSTRISFQIIHLKVIFQDNIKGQEQLIW